MDEITLKVTVDEANLILDALGNMPFKQVYTLVGKIQNQANEQLQANRTDADNNTEQQP